MDKINLADWERVFGTATQELVFTSERYTDIRFQFDEPGLASGSIQSLNAPGMRLTEISIQSGKPFQLLDDETHEAAESAFILNGNLESDFENLSGPLRFERNHHNFQYNRQFAGEHRVNTTGFHALTVTYDLQFLKQLAVADDSRTMEKLANSLHAGQPYVATAKPMISQGRISEVIGNIRICPFKGVTRYLFLESKMMELLVLQMEQAQLAADRKDTDDWQAIDKEKLYALRNFIESAYLEDFSLKDLTYRFGLNEFKMKKGYRQFFQTTVFGHVHQLRMQKAKKMLEDKAMNVTEAAFFVGYNNVSSFSTEFKKRFGYSPGKLMAMA